MNEDDTKAALQLSEAHQAMQAAIQHATAAGWGGNIVSQMRDVIRDIAAIRKDLA